MKSASLLDALQYLALRQACDERWARRMIWRARERSQACTVCAAVVKTFRQLRRR